VKFIFSTHFVFLPNINNPKKNYNFFKIVVLWLIYFVGTSVTLALAVVLIFARAIWCAKWLQILTTKPVAAPCQKLPPVKAAEPPPTTLENATIPALPNPEPKPECINSLVELQPPKE
jgi:hypothetical protein